MKLASVLKVNETEFDTDVRKNIATEAQTEGDDLDYLVQCIKEKLKIATRRKKLQKKTLVPNFWSVRNPERFEEIKKEW